jgi:hypothetical protein
MYPKLMDGPANKMQICKGSNLLSKKERKVEKKIFKKIVRNFNLGWWERAEINRGCEVKKAEFHIFRHLAEFLFRFRRLN